MYALSWKPRVYVSRQWYHAWPIPQRATRNSRSVAGQTHDGRTDIASKSKQRKRSPVRAAEIGRVGKPSKTPITGFACCTILVRDKTTSTRRGGGIGSNGERYGESPQGIIPSSHCRRSARTTKGTASSVDAPYMRNAGSILSQSRVSIECRFKSCPLHIAEDRTTRRVI